MTRTRIRIDWDRATRVAILASTLCALGFQAAFGAFGTARYYPVILPFGAALLAGWYLPAVARAAVMAAAAITPALLNRTTGLFDVPLSVVWVAALLGLVVSETRLHRWSLPPAWRLPVALWGLCIAVAWPIVTAREFDFSLALFHRRSAIFQALFIVHIASAQLAGMLWIDALFAAFSGVDVGRFERQVMWPLAAGTIASIAVGLYQMNVAPLALNPTVYGVMGRASGLMLDGNVFGTLSAMWIPGFAALAVGGPVAARWTATASAIAAGITVWGSGSRTALLAAACSVTAASYGIWKTVRFVRTRPMALVAVPAAVVLIVAAISAGSATTGPLGRIWLAADRSWAANRGIVRYLWDRDGFGTAAVQMIRESPWVGIGVGSFHSLVGFYSRISDPASGVGPDNAQNWFRHQLAELGLIGSLGWMAMVGMLLISLARRPPGRHAARSVMIAGAVVGLGLASMLGMPTQHVVVLVTFWTFVFWHDRLSGRTPLMPAWSPRSWHWAAMTIVAAVFGAVTLHAAWTDLRVPNRAARFGSPYTYGFHPAASGGQRFRRTERHAVEVFQMRAPYVKLTFWAEHPDLDQREVRLQIWRAAQRIANVGLVTPLPVTWYVRAPAGRDWMMLEFDVSRTWSGAPASGGKPVEYGISIADWEFVNVPPHNAAVIE